jgi:hypothetical protein
VDLEVAFQRFLPDAAGSQALGVQACGQVGDRLLEALGDGGEVLLVGSDQRRVGFGGKAVGEVKRSPGQRVLLLDCGSGLRLCGMTRVLRQAPGSAID